MTDQTNDQMSAGRAPADPEPGRKAAIKLIYATQAEPIELTDDQVMVLVAAVPFLDLPSARRILRNVLDAGPGRETRRRRLARWVDPYVGPGSLRVPPLREAITSRAMETVGSLLDPVVYAAEALSADPRVRRAGWKAFYFAASRAHRGAARLSRRAAELQAALAEVAIWASFGIDDREGKDGQIR